MAKKEATSTPKKAKKPIEPTKAARPAAPGEAAEAFARVEALVLAVPEAELTPINVDIPRAVSTILGSLPGCEPFIPALRELPKLDFAKIERLRDLTFAAWHAYLAATPQTSESQKANLLTEATPLRENLLVGAEALAHAGLLDKKSVASIRAGSGNLDKANDLVALATVLANAWDTIENKTAITWAEVEAAAALGPKLLVVLADRPASLSGDAANLASARAFTLMVKGYDELRRGVTFLRWHEGDADTLAPSIYAGRRRKKAADEDDEDDGKGGGTGGSD
jgi:hypothetical protein